MGSRIADTRASFRRRCVRFELFTTLTVIGALALAACAAGTRPDSINGTAGDTVIVWHDSHDVHQIKLLDEFGATFEAAHPGTKVENVLVPRGELGSRLKAAVEAKTGPDVVVFDAAGTATLALGGALAPLDAQWTSFADRAQFPYAAIHQVSGSTYAVQGSVDVLGLWYNADILEEIGVEPPTTLDELEAAMAAATRAGYGGITLAGLPEARGEWQAYPWLSAEGFDYQHPDADALEAGFDRVGGWVTNGWLSAQSAAWNQTAAFERFAAGGVAFAENGCWQAAPAAADAAFDYGVVPLPLGNHGEVYVGGKGAGIGAFSQHPDLAWAYLSETQFDRDGEVLMATHAGDVPARRDATADVAVTGNPFLEPFAASVAKYGTSYPPDVVPASSVADAQLMVGLAFKAVLNGRTDPGDAAPAVVTALLSPPHTG